MKAFQNISANGYLKRYGMKYGFLRALFLANPFHILNDYENKKILYYRKIKKYLIKKYYKYCDSVPEGLQFGECAVENPIWIYWKQGFENAPEIVNKCVKSVMEYAENPVIQLDEKCVTKYVKFPSDVMRKYNEGVISDAALADLLRFSLLEHFGGTWIDATVLLTGPIPQYILESDFFAFQDRFGLIENPALISNWLLHCKAGNVAMQKTRNMSFAYWNKEKHVIEYLFTYIILQIIIENNKEKIGWFPYANSDYCHQYLDNLAEPYSEQLLYHIKELSTIHKLTYKLKESVYVTPNTFYEHLIHEGEKK